MSVVRFMLVYFTSWSKYRINKKMLIHKPVLPESLANKLGVKILRPHRSYYIKCGIMYKL